MDYLSLSQAAKAVPAIDGKRPSISTIYRWMTQGVRGVTLEHRRIGRRVVTTAAALEEFFKKTAESPRRQNRPQARTTTRTTKQRERDVARAYARLEAHGLSEGGAA